MLVVMQEAATRGDINFRNKWKELAKNEKLQQDLNKHNTTLFKEHIMILQLVQLQKILE